MKLSLGLLVLPCLLAVGCAASSSDDGVATAGSNLDTSGCSGGGEDRHAQQGPVSVSATHPPYASCWTLDDAGIGVSYSWTQDTAAPSKPDLGFYVSMNGASDFQKPDYVSCQPASSGGISYGPDTSGQPKPYECTASKLFAFRSEPDMKNAAFSNGHSVDWNVEVAVALDAQGNWDSLNGANYKFKL